MAIVITGEIVWYYVVGRVIIQQRKIVLELCGRHWLMPIMGIRFGGQSAIIFRKWKQFFLCRLAVVVHVVKPLSCWLHLR